MSKIIRIIACECTVLAMVGVAQAKGWRGVVPLHSTRADVERLLGAPKESRGVASTYETKDERVLVFYSAGKCTEGTSNDWDVPHDTVVRLTVHPNAELLIDSLKLNKTKYERQLDYHVQGIVYYINKLDGIFISARMRPGNGEDVDNITYGPMAEDSHLRCASAPIAANAQGEKKPRTEADYRVRMLSELTTLQPDYMTDKPQLKDENLRIVVHADPLPSRVKVLYDGTSRPITENRKQVITQWANRYAGMPEFYTAPTKPKCSLLKMGRAIGWQSERNSCPGLSRS